MPDPVADLTLEGASALVGCPFVLQVEGAEPVGLVLTEARPAGTPAPGAREPFALLFRGPGPAAPQGTHLLRSDELGDLHLFLVPLEDGPQGAAYEAVFG